MGVVTNEQYMASAYGQAKKVRTINWIQSQAVPNGFIANLGLIAELIEPTMPRRNSTSRRSIGPTSTHSSPSRRWRPPPPLLLQFQRLAGWLTSPGRIR